MTTTTKEPTKITRRQALNIYLNITDSIMELARPVKLLTHEDRLRGERPDPSYDLEALRKLTCYRAQYVKNYSQFTDGEKKDLERLFREANNLFKTKIRLEEPVH